MKPYGWRMGANDIGFTGRLPAPVRVVEKARARQEAAAEMRALVDEAAEEADWSRATVWHPKEHCAQGDHCDGCEYEFAHADEVPDAATSCCVCGGVLGRKMVAA